MCLTNYILVVIFFILQTLVIAPTRELTKQISTVSWPFCKLYRMRTLCLYGGASKSIQEQDLLRRFYQFYCRVFKQISYKFMKKSNINFIFFYYRYIYNCNFYLWYSFTSMVPTLYLKIQHTGIYFYAIKSCISLNITFPYLILSSNEPVQNYINFHECFKRIYLTNKIIFLVVIGDLK